MGHIALGVISALPIFVPHRTSAFLRVIRLNDFVTELTAGLHTGFLVSCRNVLVPAYVLTDLDQLVRCV
jgi:hypothetical protein